MSAATQNEMDRLRRERDEARKERDALAAYVEAIGEYMRDQWPGAYAKVFERFCDVDPTTSLARLKAEWQPEALENCENISETYFIPELGRETKVVLLDDILKVADLLRRQAEESDDGHH